MTSFQRDLPHSPLDTHAAVGQEDMCCDQSEDAATSKAGSTFDPLQKHTQTLSFTHTHTLSHSLSHTHTLSLCLCHSLSLSLSLMKGTGQDQVPFAPRLCNADDHQTQSTYGDSWLAAPPHVPCRRFQSPLSRASCQPCRSQNLMSTACPCGQGGYVLQSSYPHNL